MFPLSALFFKADVFIKKLTNVCGGFIINLKSMNEGMKSMKKVSWQNVKVFLAMVLVLAILLPVGVGASSDFTVQQVTPTDADGNTMAVGDMDYDQAITAVDAVMILQFAVGKITLTEQQEKYADVDNSGVLDAVDALMVLQYSINKITEFPLEDALNGEGVEEKNITLSSIWAHSYFANDDTGATWQKTFENMGNDKINTYVNVLDPYYAAEEIARNVMAGRHVADVYEVSLSMCRDVARYGVAANIFASDTLDKSLYQSGATQSVTFGDKTYGVAFPAQSDLVMGVVYNKELVRKYASQYDIVELYKTKQWTFDAFKDIAKLCTKDTNGDGKIDVHGFTTNTNIIGMALVSNVGGEATMVNGRVEATFCNDSGVTALNWCKDMFKTDKSWRYMADIYSCVDAFSAGKAAMFVSYLQYYPTIASQATFTYGFVPMPIGPDQTEYINGVFDGRLFVVPTTSRLDDVGLWLNGVASANDELLNNQVKDLQRNGFDKTSCEAYTWLLNNMKPEYSTGVFSSTLGAHIDGSVTSVTKQPSKVLNAIKNQAQQELDDYYAPFYN
jgi:hypothetical protein